MRVTSQVKLFRNVFSRGTFIGLIKRRVAERRTQQRRILSSKARADLCPQSTQQYFARYIPTINTTMFASTFFRNVSVVVLLTTANALAAATPVVTSPPSANTTSPDVGSDARPQFAEGRYVINFGVNNVLRSVLGNAHDVVTALSPNIAPTPVWDIRRGENSFFLSVGGKNAVEGRGVNTIPFSNEKGSGWTLAKPFNRPAGPNDWIVLNNIQLTVFPPPEAGWKLADGKISGPLTNDAHATIFTFIRVGN